MPFTYQIKPGGIFRGLFVGGQGSGKTVAAASFPGPVLFFDFDGRMAPVKRFYPQRRDIEYYTVGVDVPPGRTDVIDYKEFQSRFEMLQNRCDWKTIVVDSITSLTLTVIRYQLNKKGVRGKRLVDIIKVPTWDEFNGECQEVCAIIEIAKILPAHVIFTAHPVDKTEILPGDVVKKTQSITAFGNKTPSFVPNYFDEIYSFTKESNGAGEPVKRIATTLAGEQILCKTALPLPPRIEFTDKPFFNILNTFLEQHEIKLAEREEELRKAALEEQAKVESIIAQAKADGRANPLNAGIVEPKSGEAGDYPS